MQRLRLWPALLVLAQAFLGLSAMGGLQLPTFTAGTNTYTNVVVTASSDGRVLVDYGRGMASAKVRDLELDVQQQLLEAGLVRNRLVAKEIERDIAKRDATKRRTEQATSPTASALTLENAEMTSIVRLFATQVEQRLQQGNVELSPEWLIGRFGQMLLGSISVALLILGVLRLFLFYRVCKNATGKGSLLVFIPVLRWIALADAARMGRSWLLVPLLAMTALFFPPPLVEKYWWAAKAYLGLLAILWLTTLFLYAIWCVRICRNVERSAVWSVFLFFPLLDYIALFVLAVSKGRFDESPMGPAGSLKNPALAI